MPGLYQRCAQLWPLFATDLHLARQQLEQLISKSDCPNRLCALVPQLTYLGAYERCRELLHANQLLDDALGRQSLFRIERQARAANPWRALIPAEDASLLDSCRRQWDDRAQILEVELVGGIGDILENHALILASFRQQQALDRLRFRISSSASWQALGPLLAERQEVPCLPPAAAASLGNNNGISRWTSPLMRCLLSDRGAEAPPAATLLAQNTDGAGTCGDAAGPSEGSRIELALNWRTKPDPRYPISSFSRSLPFRQIAGFYTTLQELLGPQAKTVVLHDLTAYNPQETAVLRHVCPQVRLAQPNLHSMADTLALLARCRQVVSVDTSLIHLRACSGRPAILLLPLFPDERWLSLLRGGCYAEQVSVLQQQQFHQWEPVLSELLTALQHLLFHPGHATPETVWETSASSWGRSSA